MPCAGTHNNGYRTTAICKIDHRTEMASWGWILRFDLSRVGEPLRTVHPCDIAAIAAAFHTSQPRSRTSRRSHLNIRCAPLKKTHKSIVVSHRRSTSTENAASGTSEANATANDELRERAPKARHGLSPVLRWRYPPEMRR